MKAVPLTNELFAGAVSIENLNGKLKPWRVDHKLRALYPSPGEGLLSRMECSAGVRLRFTTDSKQVVLTVTPRPDTEPKFDLVVDNELLETVQLSSENGRVSFTQVPEGLKTVEIWLPQGQPTEVVSLELDDAATAEIPEDGRVKWTTYGSSISQCGAAHSPSRTWPVTAARKHDLNLTCFGFGGNCHLEPMVARMIRDIPADIITLKLGINVQGGASLSPRTFEAAVIGVIEIIREKHPETPIGVISPIISPPREETDNAVELTLQKMRVAIEDAVERIKTTRGDEKLFYYDGLEMFGQDLVGPRLPDDLHPDGDGYEILGRNIANKVLPDLLAAR